MIGFLKRSSLEGFIILLLGFGLLRLAYIQDELVVINNSIENLDLDGTSKTLNLIKLEQSSENKLEKFQGRYCSLIGDTFVTADFSDKGRSVVVKWMGKNRKKVFGKYKSAPEIVMDKITIYLRHYSGEDQNLVFSEIDHEENVVSSFSIGGGIFNRAKCQ